MTTSVADFSMLHWTANSQTHPTAFISIRIVIGAFNIVLTVVSVAELMSTDVGIVLRSILSTPAFITFLLIENEEVYVATDKELKILNQY